MNTRLYKEAKRYLAGGVNSPVRSFKLVSMVPIFVKKAEGKYIYDENGRRYIDFCLSWGAILLGHNNYIIRKEVSEAIKDGLSFGFCHKYEAKLAELINRAFPSMEKMRFVNSGTEAVMSAIRLARAFTKRKKVLKFDGCYHGHSDGLLVKSGSGVSEIKESSSEGVPEEIISNTLSIPFNDISTLNKVFKKFGRELSCVIIEPIPANMGVIIPKDEFISTLKRLCEEYEVILIFDEVITGFRVSPGGAQEVFGIKPDITILGKIIGGGIPIGCFGGRKEIMENLAPIGSVYQAGTLSGNPLAMRAGIAVLSYLFEHLEVYSQMSELINEFKNRWDKKKIKYRLNSFRTIFSIFYTDKEVNSYEDARSQDIDKFKNIYRRALRKNILLPPSCFEGCFISTLHKEEDLKRILEIFS